MRAETEVGWVIVMVDPTAPVDLEGIMSAARQGAKDVGGRLLDRPPTTATEGVVAGLDLYETGMHALRFEMERA